MFHFKKWISKGWKLQAALYPRRVSQRPLNTSRISATIILVAYLSDHYPRRLSQRPFSSSRISATIILVASCSDHHPLFCWLCTSFFRILFDLFKFIFYPFLIFFLYWFFFWCDITWCWFHARNGSIKDFYVHCFVWNPRWNLCVCLQWNVWFYIFHQIWRRCPWVLWITSWRVTQLHIVFFCNLFPPFSIKCFCFFIKWLILWFACCKVCWCKVHFSVYICPSKIYREFVNFILH